MKIKALKKVLYFVYDGVMTEETTAEATGIMTDHTADVQIRNGSTPINGSLEKADYYAGFLPAEYAAAFPDKVLSNNNEGAQSTNVDAINEANGIVSEAPEPAKAGVAGEVGQARPWGGAGK